MAQDWGNLKTGDVVNGYRFIGTDPALRKDQSQWQPLQGDEFLKTLDPAVAGVVKAYSEGRQPPPTSFFLKSPYGQMIMRDVSRFDPTFDMVNYPARVATRRDFTAGKSAQTLNALNTTLGHMGKLYDLIGETASSDYPSLNWVENKYADATGKAGPNNWSAAAHLVAEEMTRAYRQAGGSENDIQAMKDGLSVNSSKEQKVGALRTFADLLTSKIQAMGEQYNKGMGTTKQGIELLNPHAQKVYNTLLGLPDDGQAVSAPQPVATTPAPPPNAAMPAASVDDLLKKYGVPNGN